MKFTELYYDDAERLALYLSQRDGKQIVMTTEDSDGFPLPPKGKSLPDKIEAFKVGSYEIAWLEKRTYYGEGRKYRNRNLNRVKAGEMIKRAREAKGVSIEDLSYITGLKARNLENIEAGRFDITIDILSNIGDALNFDITFTPR